MRKEHPVFKLADRNAVIWRYFDFPKFVSFLQNRAFFFSRADLLGDPLEGSFTRATLAQRQKLLENPPPDRTPEQLKKIFHHNSVVIKSMTKEVFINCWHLGDHESMAMWRGYGNGPYGVAVRSTFGDLDDVLPEAYPPDSYDSIFIGCVHYLDYASEEECVPIENNMLSPFVCKSCVYQHEKEVRAILGVSDNRREGYFIPVDLNRLVQSVIVSPLAKPWFADTVRETCKKFGFSFPVSTSQVAVDPIFA